ncbi:hypothetical protein BHAP_1925 [Bifidobacterium hapali]|uniref:Uncharacterized protein n=1 Tax=Bifidobacterium hapali TaxID=1630172 RepID=A0A261FVK3_9BIFI|nr:hypothetical protein BHAP_1925 [Bifidobacterium hapali]
MHHANIFLQSERQSLRDNTAYYSIIYPRSRGISPSTCLSDCKKTPAWSKICLSHYKKPPSNPITRPHTSQKPARETTSTYATDDPRQTRDIPQHCRPPQIAVSAQPPSPRANLSAAQQELLHIALQRRALRQILKRCRAPLKHPFAPIRRIRIGFKNGESMLKP